jgi:hypothetical protein
MCVHIYMYSCTPCFVSIARVPQGPRGTRLFITYVYQPNLSQSPGAHRVPGAIHWVFLFPQGRKDPGEPYSSSLVRISPTCLDPQGRLGLQGPYSGVFLCSPGAPRPQTEPYPSSLGRINPTCLDPQRPLGLQRPYIGRSLFRQGPWSSGARGLDPTIERPNVMLLAGSRALIH